MHAVRLHAFGPPENLQYEELPDPTPGEDQVRIAVVGGAADRGHDRGPHGSGLTVTAIGPRLLPRLRELATRALDDAAAGRLVPVVQHFPLARAADAHAALEARATAGKVVLEPVHGS